MTGEGGIRIQPAVEGRTPRNQTRALGLHISLSILSGIMLGFSFPPSPFGILACFGLVPLLVVLADTRSTWRALRFSYLTFLVFHIITLNWTGGFSHANDVYMMIAGTVTMTVHPLFYFLPIGAYLFARRHLGEIPALVALPAFWIAYEYTHSLSQWSFPWLTIGNSQSYDIAGIQFITATGVYGLSLWILVVNVLTYVLYSLAANRKLKILSLRGGIWIGLLLVVFYLPKVHGLLLLSGIQERNTEPPGSRTTISVGIVQPNLDPWQKWSMNGYETIELYLHLTDSLLAEENGCTPALVFWPETAIPNYLMTDRNRTALSQIRGFLDTSGVALLTGAPHAVFYEDSSTAPASAKRLGSTGQRYDAFNAAILIQPGKEEVQWYGKMRMVPFAERVPYANFLHFIDFLRWGVGIGGWQIGPDTTVFLEEKTGARFSTMVCYESTYPAFVAEFVRRGAEFISIITIDSWWGRMSGAYQHRQFSVFRAVENRRWLVRSALGGISCYIDPYGRVENETELFSRAVLCRTIEREEELTLYTQHGDWLAQGCLWLACIFLAAGVGQRFLNTNREELWKPSV
ncbi:MAG: apolipoprotein N-acyltransferase [Bacteroidota bacterium]